MDDVNPLVRALALRTMSYVHVRDFIEAMVKPLRALLKDPDPYVRKTAAFCVAKLYDHDRHLVEHAKLIDQLNGMLRDDNPTVVASALAGLMDIWERSETIKLTIDYGNASKIVQILPDCSEFVHLFPLSVTSRMLVATDAYTDGVRPIYSKPSCVTFLKIQQTQQSLRRESLHACLTLTQPLSLPVSGSSSI